MIAQETQNAKKNVTGLKHMVKRKPAKLARLAG